MRKPLFFKFAGVAALVVLPVRAQVFDVASVKPNLSASTSSNMHSSHGRFTAANVTVNMLLMFAFRVKDFQIKERADWLDSEGYDITATTEGSVDSDLQFRPALQALLASRFHLKYHRETMQLPVYSLVVAKKGSKLTEHTGGGDPSTSVGTGIGKIDLRATKVTTARLAEDLGRMLRCMVIDNTGLQGEFDFNLEWNPNESGESSLPSIFTLLQGLGLRLVSTKGPVEVIIVDSAQRPSEN